MDLAFYCGIGLVIVSVLFLCTIGLYIVGKKSVITDTKDMDKYGYIKESCSRLYPGCKVRILQYIKTTNQYRVRNVESNYVCDVSVDDVEVILDE